MCICRHYLQGQQPPGELGAVQPVVNRISNLPRLAARLQHEILGQVGVHVLSPAVLLQQHPGVHSLRHASQEGQVAVLNPLEDLPLVGEAAEQVRQVRVRGVQGHSGVGRRGTRPPYACVKLLRLHGEMAATHRHHHVQRVVEVSRWSQDWRQR